MATSFDLFGTLVAVERPDDHGPARAVAAALADRGVRVPAEWDRRYAEPHVETEPGAELSLVAHVVAALESGDVTASAETVRTSLLDAFDAPVRTRPGARAAVESAADRGPVGVLSNCSVPGLAERTLARSDLDADAFDAVVTSVDCGYRKPDTRAFDAVADALDVPLSELVHAGDDARTDGGADDAGATAVLLGDVSLAELPSYLERSG